MEDHRAFASIAIMWRAWAGRIAVGKQSREMEAAMRVVSEHYIRITLFQDQVILA